MGDSQWWVRGWVRVSFLCIGVNPPGWWFFPFHVLLAPSDVTPCLTLSLNPPALPWGMCPCQLNLPIANPRAVWVRRNLLGLGSRPSSCLKHSPCVTSSSGVVLDVVLSCGFLLRVKLSSFHSSVILLWFQRSSFIFSRDHT